MTNELFKEGTMSKQEEADKGNKVSREEDKNMVDFVVSAKLPTQYGDFLIHGFENKITGEHHVALSMGSIDDGNPVMTRLHSECLTGDVFGSARCDCGDQLAAAMDTIARQGRGIIIYLRQEGRGIGLINKLKAYALQDGGMDTVEANLALGFPPDMRDYTVGAEILNYLGVKKLKLLTNNPMKIEGLEKFGIEIIERIPIETAHKSASDSYMKTKKIKMGHILKTY